MAEGMDPARYIELKKKGAVKMMKLSKNHFAVGVLRFDPSSGAELEPALVTITREQVEATKKVYEEGAANCDELLKDMGRDDSPASGK